jgi:aminocarboxymuconate-semialdehyde decarboxylase
MNALDLHAHFTAPELLDRVRKDGWRWRISVAESPGAIRLQFGWDQFSRPFFPAMLDLTGREQWLAARGIAGQVLSPWMDLAAYHLPPEQELAWARVLNDTMAAAIAGRPAFRAFAHIPLGSGWAAAAELERAVCELGFVGGQVGTHGAGGKGLGSPHLAPLWQAAAALEVPLLLHPHGVAEAGAGPLHLLTRYPLATTEAALELFQAGVPDRHPHLAIILIHGGGFLPYQVGRFARSLGSAFADCLRFFYYDTVVDAASLRFLAERVGWERLVLGSDAPFALGGPDPVATVTAAQPPSHALDLVLRQTGARLTRGWPA